LQTACPSCDLIIDIPDIDAKQVALCPRCNHKIRGINVNNDIEIVALSLSALLMLLSSMFYPFISFSSNGITQTITLPALLVFYLIMIVTYLAYLLISALLFYL